MQVAWASASPVTSWPASARGSPGQPSSSWAVRCRVPGERSKPHRVRCLRREGPCSPQQGLHPRADPECVLSGRTEDPGPCRGCPSRERVTPLSLTFVSRGLRPPGWGSAADLRVRALKGSSRRAAWVLPGQSRPDGSFRWQRRTPPNCPDTYKVVCVSPRSTHSPWEQETGGAPRVPKWGLVGQTLGWPLDGTGPCAGEEGAHRARLVPRAGVGGNAGADGVRTGGRFFQKGSGRE